MRHHKRCQTNFEGDNLMGSGGIMGGLGTILQKVAELAESLSLAALILKQEDRS